MCSSRFDGIEDPDTPQFFDRGNHFLLLLNERGIVLHYTLHHPLTEILKAPGEMGGESQGEKALAVTKRRWKMALGS